MKKFISALLVCIIVMSSLFTVALASSGISIVIDGAQKNFDVMPQIVNGRTMVPMRAIFEEFGAQIQWDDKTRTVKATVGDTTVTLVVNYPRGDVNGKDIQLDVPPKIINGRTMVPVRFIAESLGCKVDWDAGTKTVIITGSGKNSVNEETSEDVVVKPGDIATTDYVNTTIGFGFKLPSGWEFTSREEINELYGFVGKKMGYDDFVKVLEEQSSYVDMIAKSPAGENIQLTINKHFGVGEKEVCDMLASQLKDQLTSYGMNVEKISVCEKYIAGENMNAVYMENSLQGIKVYQLMVCKNVGNYSVLFTISAQSSAGIDSIAQNIYKK